MAKLTWISVWFDDGTRYDVEPAGINSIFTTQGQGAKCGHHGPFQTPGANAPVKGPFPDSNPPHPTPGGGNAAGGGSMMAMEGGGACYYVNGVLFCP